MPLSRSDTGSSTGEINQGPVPMPAGVYTLPIHGNCPRCHHYHAAVSISVRVSSDPRRVSHVYCERCREKWLAFGGTGSTRMSLLSTRTMEPDIVERRFRYAIVDMVRSVTSLASSTALSRVPEVPSRGPSRRHSGNFSDVDGVEVQSPAIPHGRPSPQHQHPHQNRLLPQDGSRTTWLNIGNRTRLQAYLSFQRIKKKVNGQLEKLRNYDTKQLLLWRKHRHEVSAFEAETTQIKTPALESSGPPRVELSLLEPLHVEEIPPTSGPRSTDGPPPASSGPTSSLEQVPLDRVEQEMLRSMTKEQRIGWIRGQLTEFKYRHASNIARRRTSSSLNPSVTDSDDIEILPPAPSPPLFPRQLSYRRYSDDVLLTGSHLMGFEAGELFYESRRFSIGSTTRLSQAVTAVSSDGPGASSELGYSEAPPRRHSGAYPSPSTRSRRSLLRYSLGVDHLNARASMESTAAGAVQSSSTPQSNGIQTSEHRRSSSFQSPLL
ncbi:uncharacterized protein EI97DRAFT_242028 [Westerdykella ornata]|uniref:Uncharacterized protein n=1 Tax=Westerdykella ornata TaxID=318751 RepID=A0A6A6J9H0_WESOR|nr:uncharacterized protein EI97DRAFT_242028 [Westerdykella ornata]KAF2271879.1 hypothetical protein EI97DRAFT_242028 [Westerdykella ornata]